MNVAASCIALPRIGPPPGKSSIEGFYISFSGILTFKNAAELREVAKKVPLDRILIETDSPYLAPHPFRGKTNEPALVRYTAECLAELKGITLEAVAQVTSDNFSNIVSAGQGVQRGSRSNIGTPGRLDGSTRDLCSHNVYYVK